jgi:hypothetical protein
MEILAGVLIIGLVIWVSRVWVGRSGRSQNEDESLELGPSPVLYSSNPTSFIFDPSTDAGSNDSSSFRDNALSSDNVTGTQDCAPDSGNDNSSSDVDFSGSDSSSFDSGRSN